MHALRAAALSAIFLLCTAARATAPLNGPRVAPGSSDVIISGARASAPRILGTDAVAVAYGEPGGVSIAGLKEALIGDQPVYAYLEDLSTKNAAIDVGVYLIGGWSHSGAMPNEEDYYAGNDGLVSFSHLLGSVSLFPDASDAARVSRPLQRFTISDSKDATKTVRLRSALIAIARRAEDAKVTLLIVVQAKASAGELAKLMDEKDPLLSFGRLRITTTQMR